MAMSGQFQLAAAGQMLLAAHTQSTGLDNSSDSDAWLPKVEGALSAFLANELRHRLSEQPLVVNREVLVRPTNEHGAGDRTDILVEGPLSGVSLTGPNHDRVAVVVEVKGSWNDELTTAQLSQLAERYLPEADTDHGIYLVGWYPLDLWSELDQDRRRRAARYAIERLMDILNDQAAQIADTLNLITKPVALNIPRAHRPPDASPEAAHGGDA
jgi:hypothetical protein